MLKLYHKSLKEKTLQELKTFKPGSWIYCENPNEDDINLLVEKFNLEEGHIRDAMDLYEVPRLEMEEATMYIYTRFAYDENGRYATAPILIVLGIDFVLTVSQIPFPPLERFLSGKIDFYTTQKTKLFLQIFAQINTDYNSILHSISRRIRSLSVNLENIKNKDIIQFVTFETVFQDFLSALIPTSSILRNLLSGKVLKLYEKDLDLVEDLSLNINQLIELCQTNLRVMVNIREAYSTIMTNNLNRVIKLFTSLTVILTIPTMIASIYGMNVKLPFDQHPQAFLIILSMIVSISIFLLVIFNKKRWL